MGNTALGGFYPRLFGLGGSIVYRRRQITSNNSNPIGLWDAVDLDTNGNVLGLGTSSVRNTKVASVFAGVSYQDSTGARIGNKNLPASTTYTGTALWSPDAIYGTVVDNVTNVSFIASGDEALVRADIDANYDINLGTPSNGFSIQEVDSSSKAATATKPIRMLDFIDTPASDPTLAHAAIEVAINAGVLEPALSDFTGLA